VATVAAAAPAAACVPAVAAPAAMPAVVCVLAALHPRPNRSPNGLRERRIGELQRLRGRAPPRSGESAAARAPNCLRPLDLESTA